jgi:hypothetical protein
MGNQAPAAGTSEPALFKIPAQLQALDEQLPHPNTLDEAYLLAELACICHSRLKISHKAPAEFWLGLDADETKRLERFLRSADDGVSNLANDLYHYVNREVLQ